jgi:hypothetical protein
MAGIGSMLKTGLGSGWKWAKRGALIGGAVVATPIVVGAIRNNRTPDEDAPLPPAPELSAPLPQVFESPPIGANTLMGQTPVEGTFAKRVKSGRAGGIDVGSPNLMGADGRNTIDGGQGIQELNAPTGRGIG